MIWFYERGKDALRLETRFDEATKEYVLDIAWANRPARSSADCKIHSTKLS